jgi:hypothetical protein
VAPGSEAGCGRSAALICRFATDAGVPAGARPRWRRRGRRRCVAEQSQTTRRADPYRAFGDDSSLAGLTPCRRQLDHESSVGQAHLERGVVEVAAVAVGEPGSEPFEDAAVEADGVSAGVEREPVEIDCRHLREWYHWTKPPPSRRASGATRWRQPSRQSMLRPAARAHGPVARRARCQSQRESARRGGRG